MMIDDDYMTLTLRKVGGRMSLWINGEPVLNINLESFKIDDTGQIAMVTASGKIIKQGDE